MATAIANYYHGDLNMLFIIVFQIYIIVNASVCLYLYYTPNQSIKFEEYKRV